MDDSTHPSYLLLLAPLLLLFCWRQSQAMLQVLEIQGQAFFVGYASEALKPKFRRGVRQVFRFTGRCPRSSMA